MIPSEVRILHRTFPVCSWEAVAQKRKTLYHRMAASSHRPKIIRGCIGIVWYHTFLLIALLSANPVEVALDKDVFSDYPVQTSVRREFCTRLFQRRFCHRWPFRRATWRRKGVLFHRVSIMDLVWLFGASPRMSTSVVTKLLLLLYVLVLVRVEKVSLVLVSTV